MSSYRDTIGLNKKYLFGTELEFTGVTLSEVCKCLREKGVPYRFALNHKSRGFTKYDEWYVDIDSTVTKKENGEFLGGEISSRILKDEKECWLELEYVCACLQELGATCNENCSNHVWVNLSTIKNEKYFFECLAKIITIYEMEIEHFYMGDKYLKRSASYEYARLLTGNLLSYINTVDFDDPDFFYKLKNHGVSSFTRRDGINIQEYMTKKLMEIRYANGSINEKTIQNNINFSLKLVDAIAREVFDTEKLTSIINRDRENIFNKWTFNETDSDYFEDLAKTISTSTEDLDDFMSQYEKVLSTKKI